MYYEKIWSFQILALILHRKSKQTIVESKHFEIMKRFYIIAILITIAGMTAMAQNRPDITHQSTGRDRGGVVFYADRPTLVFDNVTNQIEVYGSDSDYYNVAITSTTNNQVVFTAVIDGNYDIIDANIMSSGAHVIALTSSHGNTYRWTFDQGLQGGIILPEGIDKSGSHIYRLNDFGNTPSQF